MKEMIINSVWTAVFIGIAVSIVTGNGLILLSIAKSKRLRSNMYILIGNLAISDLLVGLVLIPYYLLTDGWKVDSGNGIIPKSKYVCLGKLSVFVICLGSSCMSLLHISIERFASLAYPIKAKFYLTSKKVIVVILTGWLVIIANGIQHFFVFNTYDINNNTSCVSDDIVTSEYKILINWELIIGLTVNIVMYAITIRIALRTSSKKRSIKGGLTVHSKSDRNVYQVFTMAIVFGAFLICWMPYMCAAMATTFNETPLTQQFRRYTLIPGLLNSSLNWIIYGFRNPTFRNSFKSLVACNKSSREIRSQYRNSYLNPCTVSLGRDVSIGRSGNPTNQ